MFWMPLIGAALGALKNQAAQDRENRTKAAAADAQAVSWARRDGRGFIPEVQYNQGSWVGDVATGAMGGMMQGAMLNKLGAGGEMDWNLLGGGSGTAPSNPYEAATTGGIFGYGSNYSPETAKNFLGPNTKKGF